MNCAVKTIAEQLTRRAIPCIAAWVAWRRFSGKPIRPNGLDIAALAVAVGVLPELRQLLRVRNQRPLKRIPAGLAFRSIALTFDDSPNPSTTPAILDALRDAGAKATFFASADRIARSPELIRRILAEGHSLGMSGIDGAPMSRMSARQVEHALKMIRREIGPALPQVNLFRPPGGCRSLAMQHALDRLGLTMVTWSFNPKDESVEPDELVRRIALKASHGDIVLLHDGRESTAIAVPTILKRLQGREFQLVRL